MSYEIMQRKAYSFLLENMCENACSLSKDDWNEFIKNEGEFINNSDIIETLYKYYNYTKDKLNEIKYTMSDWGYYDDKVFEYELDAIKNLSEFNLDEARKNAINFFMDWELEENDNEEYKKDNKLVNYFSNEMDNYPSAIQDEIIKEIEKQYSKLFEKVLKSHVLSCYYEPDAHKIIRKYFNEIKSLDHLNTKQYTNLANSGKISKINYIPNFKEETTEMAIELYNLTTKEELLNILKDVYWDIDWDDIDSESMKVEIRKDYIDTKKNDRINNRITAEAAKDYLNNNKFSKKISIYPGKIGMEDMTFDHILIDGEIQGDTFEINRQGCTIIQAWINDRDFGDHLMTKDWFYETVDKYLIKE